MASRGRDWFDEAKLLPSERLIRSATVRLRISGPPYWWEGRLTLTSDRLFFLPYVDHPRLNATAFWLCDMPGIERSGRNRFTVRAGEEAATFQIVSSRRGPAGLTGDQAVSWVAAVTAARPAARPRAAFERPARRAAG
jgi:hypothetical protein